MSDLKTKSNNNLEEKPRDFGDRDIISFDDYDRRRKLVFDYAADAVKKRFPLDNDRYMLEVEDVGYDDLDKPYSTREQKASILSGKTLTKQLKGRFILKDKATGQVIEKGGRRVLANIPYLTPRGTFIRNGNESVVINQIRMVPGAYHRKTEDGMYESFVNVKQGTGTQFKIQFDPATAQFHVRAGGRKIPAYPFMKAMGVTDEDLKAAWGEDILNKNKVANEKRAVDSAHKVFVDRFKRGK